MLINGFAFIGRKPEMSPVLFESELPRAAKGLTKLDGIARGLLHRVVDDSQLGIDHARGHVSIDAFAELIFESSLGQDEAIGQMRARWTDIGLDDLCATFGFVTCRKNIVIPIDDALAAQSTKRMSIITRRPSIDHALFVSEWTGKHARDVPALPRIAGYSQNIVTGRFGQAASEATANELPADGIVELWFPDKEAIIRAFASPQADITQTHAKSFLQTITTFLVETQPLS